MILSSFGLINLNMPILLISILITVITSYVLIPSIIKISSDLEILDFPDNRKRHKKPLVRLGGLSIAISSILTFYLVYYLFFYKNNNFSINIDNRTNVILISSVFILVLGLIDDIFILSPLPRLSLQIANACFLWTNGIAIEKIDTFGLLNNQNFIILPKLLSITLTVIWIVGFTNALNWIDGIDGLAISIVSVTLIGNLYLFHITNNYELFLLTLIILSACLTFMKFNIKPSVIIMGDGGCYFLGYFLASTTLIAATSSNKVTFIFTPILAFAVPLFDMTVVIFKRLFSLKSPLIGDRGHIHHILLEKNFSENQIVIFLSCLSQWSLIIGIQLFQNEVNLTVITASTILLLFGFIFLLKKIFSF